MLSCAKRCHGTWLPNTLNLIFGQRRASATLARNYEFVGKINFNNLIGSVSTTVQCGATDGLVPCLCFAELRWGAASEQRCDKDANMFIYIEPFCTNSLTRTFCYMPSASESNFKCNVKKTSHMQAWLLHYQELYPKLVRTPSVSKA